MLSGKLASVILWSCCLALQCYARSTRDWPFYGRSGDGYNYRRSTDRQSNRYAMKPVAKRDQNDWPRSLRRYERGNNMEYRQRIVNGPNGPVMETQYRRRQNGNRQVRYRPSSRRRSGNIRQVVDRGRSNPTPWKWYGKSGGRGPSGGRPVSNRRRPLFPRPTGNRGSNRGTSGRVVNGLLGLTGLGGLSGLVDGATTGQILPNLGIGNIASTLLGGPDIISGLGKITETLGPKPSAPEPEEEFSWESIDGDEDGEDFKREIPELKSFEEDEDEEDKAKEDFNL